MVQGKPVVRKNEFMLYFLRLFLIQSCCSPYKAPEVGVEARLLGAARAAEIRNVDCRFIQKNKA